jgi:hypothetical protein
MLLHEATQDFQYVQEGRTIHVRKGQVVRVELRSEAERITREGVARCLGEPLRERASVPASASARASAPADHARAPARKTSARAPKDAPAAPVIEVGSIVLVRVKKGDPREGEVVSLDLESDTVKVRYDGDKKLHAVKTSDVAEVVA